MKEFTFICISYCQENVITEHLDSIRRIIEHFGRNIENDLIVADDGSGDSTADVARKWIENNRDLFRRAEVLPTEANMGTVKNIFRAVDSCRTEHFKILAGDDKYNDHDIYALYDSITDEVVITPVLPFGEFNGMEQQLIKSFRRSYRLVMAYQKKNRLGEALMMQTLLLAPGVFTPSKYWKNSEIRKLLANFVYFEDIPMWLELFYNRKTPVRFVSIPYVYYRIEAKQMLSSTKGEDFRKIDHDTVHKFFPKRLRNSKKRFINPNYYKFLIRKLYYTNSTRYDDFFMADPQVKQIYIDGMAGETNASR